jgi:hypothetical protein
MALEDIGADDVNHEDDDWMGGDKELEDEPDDELLP